MPTTTAPVEAGNIGSGNFGGLRGQTAVDTSKANALATLNTAQNQAALQNQATGVNAGAAAGNVGQQNINNLLTTGQYQQASPYVNATNLGNVLSSVTPGQTVSNTTNLSPVNQIGGLITALGGGANTGILNQLFGAGSAAVPGTATTPGTAAVAPGLLNQLWSWANSPSASTDPTAAAQQAALTNVANTPNITNTQSDPTSVNYIGI